MILIIGSSNDRVYGPLTESVDATGHPLLVVDEDFANEYQISCKEDDGILTFKIIGGSCNGTRPVNSIFVRHAIARTFDSHYLEAMVKLQTNLNYLLLLASCPVINSPINANSNYAKPYQLRLLAEAGFEVPKTLITNVPNEVRLFNIRCKNNVIFKGVSNMITLARLFKKENYEDLSFLPNCPSQFQEFIDGVDYRVHVVGDETFVTRLIAQDEDYRRAVMADSGSIRAEPATLPRDILKKCIKFTKKLGLIVSGIDFKENRAGQLVALELNPYPQFTFYEGRSGQSITQAVVNYLVRNQSINTNVFA